jgi:hypothetical protein
MTDRGDQITLCERQYKDEMGVAGGWACCQGLAGQQALCLEHCHAQRAEKNKGREHRNVNIEQLSGLG